MYITKWILILINYRKQVINNNYKNATVQRYYVHDFNHFYKANLRFFARIIVEILKYNSSKDSKIKFKNIDDLESKCIESKGLILLASHYGNWELACTLLPKHTPLPCYGVYKPLKNKSVDQYMKKKRSKNGLQLIPMKKIGRTIIENMSKDKPAIYILIADQNPNSKNSVIWTKFLEIKTAFVNGPMKLVHKYKFNVACMEVSVGENLFDYTINMNTDIRSEHEDESLTQAYAQNLEAQIIKSPEYWLWSHKRWKRSFLE